MADPRQLKVNQFQGNWNGRRKAWFASVFFNFHVFEEHVVVPEITMEDASHWTAALHRIDKNDLGQTIINQMCEPFGKLVIKKNKGVKNDLMEREHFVITSGRLTSCANSIIFLAKSLAIWAALTS